MKTTPDLSREFHPVPKTYKSKKTPAKLGPGKKTKNWEDGREKLKKQFAAYGITTCEIGPELLKLGENICVRDNFLGFAHTQRRINFSLEGVVDARNVVLGCQPCHNYVDNEMPHEESKTLLETIVKKREIFAH